MKEARTRIATVRYKNGFTVHRFNPESMEPRGQPRIDHIRAFLDDMESTLESSDENVNAAYVVLVTEQGVMPYLSHDGEFPASMLPAVVDVALKKLNDILLHGRLDTDIDEDEDYD